MDAISHYQKSIEKSQNDPKRLLHCLDRLDRLSITVQLLEDTGVGRTVNSLRKYNGEVGSAAKALIAKWKNHVLQSTEGYSQSENKDSDNEQKYSETTKSEDEEERLVIDTTSNHKPEEKESPRKSEKSSHKKEDKHHHHSSSSSSHKHKSSKSHKRDKEKDEKKSSHEKDSKSHRKSEKDSKSGSSSKDHKHSSSSKRKLNESEEPRHPKILKTEVVDSSMGFSFEDALGMSSLPSTSKGSSKPSKSSDSSSKKSKHSSNSTETLGLLSPSVKLPPLDPNITASIPTISNNYKPAPINPNVMDCIYPSEVKQRRILTDEEALSHGISSKTMRTKVYSGAKTGMKFQVPSLYNLCIRILQKNIDNLEYTGGVPFEILKPVLLLASPQQLEMFEMYNPYLMEETDTLWELHCKKHCRGQRRQEMESWREMYFRFQSEQEHKLQNLTKNIKKSQQEIALPVKKTQLAYVDSAAKAPRNVAKKQEIYGTKNKLISTPAARVAALQSITPNAAKVGDARLRVAAGVRDAAQASSSVKPKKAPLMAKMISMMKSRRR